jgi:hypothetical protein
MSEAIGIPVGSGHVYETAFTGTIPSDAEIETASNRLGYIEKGATLTYKPTYKTFSDDMGQLRRSKLTAEEVTFKFGLISWAYGKLNALCSTCRITEKAGGGGRTIKIGGIANDDGKRHLVRFVHSDAELGDLRITIVGTNTGGLALKYAPDDSTNVEPEITASPSDDEGTLVILDETDPGAATLGVLTVTSTAGTTTGKTVIAVSPTLTSGNSYKYYTAASITLPILNATSSTYTAWDGTSEITATTGNEIAIVEVDSSGLVKKAGKTTVTAKA